MQIKYDNTEEKHTFGKILGIAAAVVPEDKEIQALIQEIIAQDAKIPEFNADDCEYDIDNNECLATGCGLYSMCTLINKVT